MKKVDCNRCGYCCTLITKITFLEKLRIMLRGHFNFTDKDSTGRVLKRVNGDCTFLTRKDGLAICNIYNIRPQVCRDFPYKGAKECDIPIDKRTFRERLPD